MPFRAYARLLHQIWSAPGNAGHRLASLRRAARWFLRRKRAHPGDPPVLLPVFDGRRLYPCHTDSVIAMHTMYRSEWFDWDMLHFLRDYLRPGDHFLDIGANTGLHTLLASTVITPDAGGRLTCIEPDPLNVTRLRHTLEVNHLTQHVTLHPVAASDQPGHVTLTDRDAYARIAAHPSSRIPDRSTIPAVPLDEIVDRGAMFHACKIDVEGAEGKVLRGASHLIREARLPCLILELCGHLERYGETDAALLDWLRTQGYTHIGTYHHASRTFRPGPPFDSEDVFAFTDAGLAFLKQRMPEMKVTP